MKKANIGTSLYHNVRVMSEAHRPVEHFLQRRGLSEKDIIKIQYLSDTQLMSISSIFLTTLSSGGNLPQLEVLSRTLFADS